MDGGQISGVTMPKENMSFSVVLQYLQTGYAVARKGWHKEGVYLGLQRPDEHSMNRQPYIFIVPEENQRVPWTASQTDLLATDWYIVVMGGVAG